MLKSHDLGLLVLRFATGGLMLVHGLPKLMLLFGNGPIQFPDPLGVGMTLSLILAVFSEVLCSILIILGFKARMASLFLAITMFVAAFMVHFNDPWDNKEKAILFLSMYIVLIVSGSGKYSLDKN